METSSGDSEPEADAAVAEVREAGPTPLQRSEEGAAAVATPGPGPRRWAGEEREPAWLAWLSFATAAAVTSFGLAGLVLAVLGEYRPSIAYLLGAVGTAAMLLAARPALRGRGAVRRSTHVVAAAGVACVLAITVWNVTNSSEHVLITRDGGSYTTTGRWLASHGTLDVDARVGPFDDPRLVVRSFATYEQPDGTLQVQFVHLLPVLLAEAHRIGGDTLMFEVAPILGGFALLAFFVLAWRVLRAPWFALAATVVLGTLIPQVSFARDTYSEIPSQVLLFTALWMLTDRALLRHWSAAAAVGVLLGATQAIRIDALILLLALPLALMVLWLREPVERRRSAAIGTAALAAGLVPGLAIGFWDAVTRSGGYWDDLGPEVRTLARAGALTTVLALAVAVVARRVRVPDRLRALVRSPAVAVPLAAGVSAVGFAAWIVRPHVQTYRGTAFGHFAALQELDGVALPDPTRRFYERSLEWMAWYLGPVLLAAAIVAAGLLAVALVRGRRLHVLPALCAFAPSALLYLWHAHAAPDHVWVTRRFLTGAFPLLVLLGFGLAAALAVAGVPRAGGRTARRAALAGRFSAALIVAATIAHTLVVVTPIARMREQRDFVRAVYDVCGTTGPDAAIVVLQSEAGIMHEWVPQTLRAWCGVPVAVMLRPLDTAALSEIATAWRAEDRTLWVVSDNPATITSALPGAAVVGSRRGSNPHMLQETIVVRPDRYRHQWLELMAAPVLDG